MGEGGKLNVAGDAPVQKRKTWGKGRVARAPSYSVSVNEPLRVIELFEEVIHSIS